jgi:Tfp pilus assembly PilM family ATPase
MLKAIIHLRTRNSSIKQILITILNHFNMPKTNIIPIETIESKILLIRDQKVLLDKDLASLYGVATRDLNKAITRNFLVSH